MPTNHLFHGDEHFGTPGGAIHEYGVHGQVAGSGVHAVGLPGHHHTGHADVVLIADQVFRVIDLDGQANQGRYRGECDVTLVPGDLQAQHFLAVPFALADDAFVRNGTRVGAGHR